MSGDWNSFAFFQEPRPRTDQGQKLLNLKRNVKKIKWTFEHLTSANGDFVIQPAATESTLWRLFCEINKFSARWFILCWFWFKEREILFHLSVQNLTLLFVHTLYQFLLAPVTRLIRHLVPYSLMDSLFKPLRCGRTVKRTRLSYVSISSFHLQLKAQCKRLKLFI